MSNLDGGLWPLFWITLVICITIYKLKTRIVKAARMTSTPSKATAGPWCIPAGEGNELIVCEGDDPKKPGRILFVFRHPVGTKRHLSYEKMAANCRLSAAAPDLLAALEVLLEEATGFSVSGVYFDEECMGHKGPALARAAISRATGEA